MVNRAASPGRLVRPEQYVNNDPRGARVEEVAIAKLITSLWLLVLLAGCAVVPPISRSPSLPAQTPDQGWWYARFRMQWPAGEDPAWSTDLLLADQVLAPVLEKFREQLVLWRFHRRAGRDAAGHQFSLIFYADAQTASRVYAEIAANPVLRGLQRQGVVESLVLDDPAMPLRADLGATSDASWPPEIQETWPTYIMGVSRMWLGLIQAIDRRRARCADLQQRYAEVNDELTQLWRSEGGHAFFHHLSAMFGYEPLQVIRKDLMRF